MSRVLISFCLLLCSPILQAQVFYGAPDWSPDGMYIAYISNVSGNSELYIYDVADKISTQITTSDSSEWSPSWSRDGNSIAYISDRDSNKEIYLYTLASDAHKQITYTLEEEEMPSWLDPETIIHIANTTSNNIRNQKIFTVTLGGKRKNITPDSSRNYIYPGISPNGETLLYSSKSRNSGAMFHIWTTNLKTQYSHRQEDTERVSYNPSWSNDGKQILYVHQSDKDIRGASLFLKNINEVPGRILKCESGCFQPRMSPNGKFVVYREGWINGHKGIYLLDLESGKTKKIIGN